MYTSEDKRLKEPLSYNKSEKPEFCFINKNISVLFGTLIGTSQFDYLLGDALFEWFK